MVSDIERSIEWYERVLGLHLADRRQVGQTLLAFLETGNTQIELIQRSGSFPAEGVVNHVAFQVDDLTATIEAIRAAGVELDASTVRPIWGGGQILFFDGPDGEVLELFQPGR